MTNVAAGLASCGRAATAQVITVTIVARDLGPVVATDYLGFGFEASVLDSARLDPSQSNLTTLLRDLGVGRLRFGGNSLDRVTAWRPDPGSPLPAWSRAQVTPEDLAHLGALTAATGWRVDLGLNLGHPDATGGADEAATAARLLGPGLASVEIGNEPDGFGPSLRPAGYGYARYLGDVA